MRNRCTVAYGLLAACLLCTAVTGETALGNDNAQEPDVLFARDIQPLLAKHCLLCHGPDEAEAGLRLDSSDKAREELESGEHAIVPGDADASELLNRVSTDDTSLQMPPDGEPLSDNDVALLRQWIEAGAEYEVHWAYRPVTEPPLPKVTNAEWIRNPIDQFVLARLEHEGVTPSPAADRATLIKRLHYDLTGLPPTPAQVDTFVKDNDPAAYEHLVDQLLASPHFGERWGRHWLDKARYADSDGYEKDNPRPNAWRYRDWVIQAINRDMPYDEFTIEQLAGDLLPNPTPAQKLATAFHRQTLTNTEGGTDKEEFRVEATFDRTETTSAVWMALTMTCARCHTHKYDQIQQREYYQLFAFFDDANEANIEIASSEAAQAKYHSEKAAHDAQVARLSAKYEDAKQRLQPQVEKWLDDMAVQMQQAEKSPVEFHSTKILEATSQSKATLVEQPDKSFLATGPSPDKDKYTLVLEAPKGPLTGIRLELLAHDSLAKKGPGRTPHGNLVLTELRAYVSDDRSFSSPRRVELVSAEADFAQKGFAPEGALQTKDRSGWAISPQMSKNHHATFYAKEPWQLADTQFLQIVLDQQYGGKHTIGCFRVSTMSGFNPLRALPSLVAEAVKTTAHERSPAQQKAIVEHVASLHSETAQLATELAKLKQQAPASPMMKVRVITPAQRTTKVLHRGDFLQPADKVDSDVLEVVSYTHPLRSRTADQPADRLDLARWLVDRSHPLTPRVTVNHIWAHLFGRGIVATINDFGVRGDRPTHPKLLDWLAWQLPRDMDWSRKTLIKTIVMSATYRQSSHHRPDLRASDPTNRLLARQNRVRVEAEVIRDLFLAVSGLLSTEVGGASVFPPLPPGVAELSYANNFKWKTSKGGNRYRRGMYTFFKRTSPHPTLISFDCPDSNTARLERETSNTPLQALATLNNDVFAETAQAMTQRVFAEGGTNDTERLSYALRLCIARSPEKGEVEHFRQLLTAARDYYRDHGDDAKKLAQRHVVEDITVNENATWIATIRMIMNLDEFIVRD